MITAYEKWLVETANSYEIESISNVAEAKKEIIAQLLINDCMNQNPQAFDIIGKTGDKGYTRETFVKAAQIVIDSVGN